MDDAPPVWRAAPSIRYSCLAGGERKIIDARRLPLEICNPEYQGLIESFYEPWSEFNNIAFAERFDNSDIPLIIIEPLAPLDQEGIAMGTSVGGQFWFSEYRDGQYLPKSIECEDPKGVEWDPYADFIPTYWLDETTLKGDDIILRSGPDYEPGRLLFMKDVLLHRMLHHDVYKCEGSWEYRKRKDAQKELEAEADRAPIGGTRNLDHFWMWMEVRKEHTMFFRDARNRVASRLGLREVEFYARGEEHAANRHKCCSGFPHNVRPGDYYLGAKI